MKKILTSILVFAFLYTVSNCAQANTSMYNKEAGYISLSASKTIETDPNLARVTFAVENTAETAKKATADNNEISNKIISALKEIAKTDTDTIKTSNFSVRPIYSTTKDGRREIKNYSAINSVIVETKDTSKIGKFIDTAIASGANRTENLYFSYNSDNKLCSQTYPILLKELKEQADLMAKSVGTEVEGIKNINVSCSASNSIVSAAKVYAATNMEMATDMSVPVETGKAKVQVYVNANFYVK